MSRHDSSDCPEVPTKRTNPTPARRAGALTAAMSLALLTATGAAIAVPTSASSDTPLARAAAVPVAEPAAFSAATSLSDRQAAVALSSSRSATRGEFPTPDEKVAETVPEPEIIGKRYSTVPLNVRKDPDSDADVVTTLDVGDKIKATDVKDDGWRLVIYNDKERWVKAEFLSKSKPPKPAATSSSSGGGVSSAACSSGSGVEGGLGANAIAVHRAVCARYPQVGAYGGYRAGGGNHSTGRALDIMISGSAGWDIANWLRANSGQLGITEIIYSQKIWTSQRAGDGWRGMSNRGSATANHYDHVHVTTR